MTQQLSGSVHMNRPIVPFSLKSVNNEQSPPTALYHSYQLHIRIVEFIMGFSTMFG